MIRYGFTDLLSLSCLGRRTSDESDIGHRLNRDDFSIDCFVANIIDITSGQAWNHLGAAAELVGRKKQAIVAYRVALGLLKEQGSMFCGVAEETGKTAWEEALRITGGNLGRALVLAGEAEEAAQILEQLQFQEDDVTAKVLRRFRRPFRPCHVHVSKLQVLHGLVLICRYRGDGGYESLAQP